jgi:hypothetical protein
MVCVFSLLISDTDIMEKSKRCEVCGEMKPLNDFSKSYKNRCKKCVSDMEKSKRKIRNEAKDYNAQMMAPNRISESFLIDWEQRRYETAKDLSCAYLIAHPTTPYLEIAKACVEFADTLLNELKVEQHDEQSIQDP